MKDVGENACANILEVEGIRWGAMCCRFLRGE